MNNQLIKQTDAERISDMDSAIANSTNDYEKFQTESEERIKYYEKKIDELNIKITHEKGIGKIKYNRMVSDFEVKAIDLKKTLSECKEEGLDRWDLFKLKFNNNLNDLGISISDFFTDDTNTTPDK